PRRIFRRSANRRATRQLPARAARLLHEPHRLLQTHRRRKTDHLPPCHPLPRRAWPTIRPCWLPPSARAAAPGAVACEVLSAELERAAETDRSDAAHGPSVERWT